MANATIIIPAREGSTRFPGKVLISETGRPLIQHVCEQASRASCADRLIVATDSGKVREAVERFGGEAVITRADHANGTSRIAEVAESLDDDIIVNVQGDEPEIEPELIDAAVDALLAHDDCVVGTAASPFMEDEDPADPNIVKVACDAAGRALYFSRALIPHYRDAGRSPEGPAQGPLKHVGLYVYRRPFLAEYVRLAPTPLEQTEQLEQLRILEHGRRIAVAVRECRFHGIDTPQQYAEFVHRWRAKHGR